MAKAIRLEDWFDVERPIGELELALTEMQLMLEAVKLDIDPDGAEAHRRYRGIRKAVAQHNRKFA